MDERQPEGLGIASFVAMRTLSGDEHGGHIVAGQIDSNDGDVSGNHGIPYSDAWVVKLNAQGGVK
jgi:hypothetical protein